MKKRPRRRRAVAKPAPAPLERLLRLWPLIAFGLAAVGGWYDIRQQTAVNRVQIEALNESVKFLSAQFMGPKERGH